MYHLRPYQESIVSRVRSHMRQGNRSILIQSPTGSGKTVMLAYMVKRAAEKGYSSWFCVHRRELLKQSMETFHEMGIRFGLIASGWDTDPDRKVHICSVQTLARRIGYLRKPMLCIVDECHHITAGSYTKIYRSLPESFHIGLTATPERLDGEGLGKHYQVLVEGPSVRSLIDSGSLSDYKIYAPSTISTDGVRTRMGDFARKDLAAAVRGSKVTGDVIRHYRRLCPGKRAIAFCASVDHSKEVVSRFLGAGIPAAHVDGKTPDAERDQAMDDFKAGRTLVLSNCELFGEGVDVPAIEAAILLRPTQSLGLHLQQVGRSLRPAPGKKCAIILDHAGNSERHGLPDDEREWTLEGHKGQRKAEQSVSKIKSCPACYGCQRPGRDECIYCGHKFEVQARKVAEEDGELVEVDKDALRKERKEEERSAKTLEQLVALGKARGYHPGWAFRIHKIRQQYKARRRV